MKTATVLAFLSTGFGVGTAWAGQPVGSITLRVVNSANVGWAELAEGQKLAGYILGKAGVKVVWQDCSGPAGHSGVCASPVGPGEFWMHITTWKPTVAAGETLGFTATDRAAGNDEGMAGIYYPMVKAMAVDLQTGEPEILGAALAHEIGHLLGLDHSATGVMYAHLGRNQIALVSAGGLLFSSQQASQIRTMLSSKSNNAGQRSN